MTEACGTPASLPPASRRSAPGALATGCVLRAAHDALCDTGVSIRSHTNGFTTHIAHSALAPSRTPLIMMPVPFSACVRRASFFRG